jgi:GDP/UDP-N,N'-diacetylbacillosamine 2-epimerase (hydrolysing)
MKKKILIITERRADYSKLRPIIKLIKKSSKLDYNLIVTGSHLLKKYGYTINEIKKDGFKITSKFKMFSNNEVDTGFEMTRSFGRSVIHISNIIEKIKPDIILSGFDISANFAAAIIGAHTNHIVVHLEAGEITGTIDEPIRHSMSKFAHIHFTSNNTATKRLIKMGENPKFIFTVGSPTIDEIKKIRKISKKELEDEFGLELDKPFIIMMQHTVTTEINKIDKYFLETLNALKELKIQTVIIHGNADAGSKIISKIIKNSKIHNYPNLPYEKYINLLKHASVLVGNSSSGIIEAPFLHIPSINIGTRQSGRLSSKSVINVKYDKKEIKKAIEKAIKDKKYQNKVKKNKNHYGNGNAAVKIVKILEKLELNKIPIQKKLMY